MAEGISRRQLVEEVDFLERLLELQRRAFLPLRALMLVLALIFWGASRPVLWPPPADVFALFLGYGLALLAETYFVWVSRPARRQIRPLCLASYILDVLFVTLLVWFDSVRYAAVASGPTDFYLLYFIVLLRSFALFRTARATLLVNGLIGILFLVNLLWQDSNLPSYSLRNNLIRVAFFWLVVFLSGFIAALINRQKAELMAVREKLVRSENLARVGQLAAGVAHEINNPIGIISAYVEFLEKNASPDDPRREDFQAIHREAQRCKHIVEGLLNLARTGEASRQELDLREILRQVVVLLERATPEDSVRLELALDADTLPPVVGDRAELTQALLNILLNARQSLPPEGGVIRIHAESQGPERRVALIVEDTGKGMEPEVLAHVFEPFFSTRPGGTGLGLAITRRIVEEHGGEIQVASTPGGGTRVTILLPAVESRRRGSSARLRRVV